MRKDVECTFGIMKGRFRILKTGIPLHGIEATDKIWHTCCALHNFLLEEDGLDVDWDASQYLFGAGGHDEHDVCHFLGIDNPIKALGASNNFDNSGMGPGSDVSEMDDNHSEVTDSSSSDCSSASSDCNIASVVPDNQIDSGSDMETESDEENVNVEIPVDTLKLDYFRQKLIEHFDILWKQGKIKWPSRTGDEPPPQIHEPYYT